MPIETNNVVERLIAMVVQSAREREAASRLPDCIDGAQQRLDQACKALSDRIDVLEGRLSRCQKRNRRVLKAHAIRPPVRLAAPIKEKSSAD